MVEGGFVSLLSESFEALRVELPAIHDDLCAMLFPRAVAMEVDGEHVEVRFERRAIRVSAARPGDEIPGLPRSRKSSRGGAAIEVTTTRVTIVEMVDARWSLAEAIESDRLLLRGEVDDLIAFHDGLIVYLHGAVRAPSFPPLLRRLRAEAAGRGARSAGNASAWSAQSG